MQYAQDHRVQRQRVTGSRDLPRDAGGVDHRQVLTIEGGGDGLPRFDHKGGMERRHHCGHAAEMIGVSVRDHEGRQRPHTSPTEEGEHHPPSRVRFLRARARIDQEPSPARRLHGDGISLPHVQHVDRKLPRMFIPSARGDGHEHPSSERHGREQSPMHDAPRWSRPSIPQHDREEDGPGNGEPPPCGAREVPTRKCGRPCRDVFDGGEGEPGSTGHATPQDQAREHARNGHAGKRHSGEVGEQADGCHGTERVGCNRRGEQRRARASSPQPEDRVPAEARRQRPAGLVGTPHGGHREPGTRRRRNPRVQQEDHESGHGQHRSELGMTSSRATQPQDGEKACRSRRGCGTSKQEYVRPDRGRGPQPRLAPRSEQPNQQMEPGRDDPDVQTRDRQQMGEPRGDEGLPDLRIDVVAAAEYQRLDDPRAPTVQTTNPTGDVIAHREPPSPAVREHMQVPDAQHPAGVIGTDHDHHGSTDDARVADADPQRSGAAGSRHEHRGVGDASRSWRIMDEDSCGLGTRLPDRATFAAPCGRRLRSDERAERHPTQEYAPPAAMSSYECREESTCHRDERRAGKQQAGPHAGPVRHRQPHDRWHHGSAEAVQALG